MGKVIPLAEIIKEIGPKDYEIMDLTEAEEEAKRGELRLIVTDSGKLFFQNNLDGLVGHIDNRAKMEKAGVVAYNDRLLLLTLYCPTLVTIKYYARTFGEDANQYADGSNVINIIQKNSIREPPIVA